MLLCHSDSFHSLLFLISEGQFPETKQTRMHSSRMRTARSLTYSVVSDGGGGWWGWGGWWWSAQPPLDADPTHCGQEWHTLVKILPCPKLRLRAVINYCRCSSQLHLKFHEATVLGFFCTERKRIFAAVQCEQQIGLPENPSGSNVTFAQCKPTFNPSHLLYIIVICGLLHCCVNSVERLWWISDVTEVAVAIWWCTVVRVHW